MKKSRFMHRFSYKQVIEYSNEQKSLKYSLKFKLIIFFVTLLFCTFFYSFHFSSQINLSSEMNIAPGSVWSSQTVTADFSYPIYKEYRKYLSEVKKARDNSLLIFSLDETAQSQSFKTLDAIINSLRNITPDNYNNSIMLKGFSKDDLRKIAELPESQRTKELQTISKVLRQFIAGIYRNGLVNKSIESILNKEVVVQLPPNKEVVFSKDQLTDSSTILDRANKVFEFKLPHISRELAIEIISNMNFPNLIYNHLLSEQSKELAEKSVARTEGIVRKGETIVSKSEIISQETYKKLQSYDLTKKLQHEKIYTFWYFLGSFIHSGIIYLILLMYLFFIRKRIFFDNYQLIILSTLLIFIALMSWLSIEITSTIPIEFLIILPAFSMLAAIVFDSRTAFYITITMSLMLSGIRGNDYDLGIGMLFAGTLAAYTVRDIQSRTQMFKSIFYIFIGLVIPIVSIALERSADTSGLLNKIVLSMLNAGFSPLITFGLLFVLERFSNITTDLRLQEFDNLNHPLLVKLSEVAPGTFQHTLAVAVLAEKCASAIDANALLAKVGAYFHDIGKILKPEYFTENQMNIGNKHDSLAPLKSAEAIRHHVTDGVNLAKEYNLPQRIIDFIPMHHGNSVIKHFYAKAIEISAGHNVNIADFQYQGSKPHSKETAIVMICDACEALSKVPFKDNEELEKNIGKNIQDKLIDGQFDESSLTMYDIKIIRDTCIKNILATVHPRVEYKQVPEENTQNNDSRIISSEND